MTDVITMYSKHLLAYLIFVTILYSRRIDMSEGKELETFRFRGRTRLRVFSSLQSTNGIVLQSQEIRYSIPHDSIMHSFSI